MYLGTEVVFATASLRFSLSSSWHTFLRVYFKFSIITISDQVPRKCPSNLANILLTGFKDLPLSQE